MSIGCFNMIRSVREKGEGGGGCLCGQGHTSLCDKEGERSQLENNTQKMHIHSAGQKSPVRLQP